VIINVHLDDTSTLVTKNEMSRDFPPRRDRDIKQFVRDAGTSQDRVETETSRSRLEA